MKVYPVWYISRIDNKTAHLWAIYETKEKAEEEIRKIKLEDYGTSAWYNEEEVL